MPSLVVSAKGQLPGSGQNFGVSKKTITLHRKLPAMVHLTGTTFAVQAVSHDGTQAEVAQVLTDILESTLLKNDKNLTPDKTAPAITISCTITHYETPPPQAFVRQEWVSQNGKVVQANVNYNHFSGAIDVAYRASQRNGKILDSDNLSAKYAQDFQQGTNQAASKPGSITDEVQFWKKKTPKPGEQQQPALPPTVAQLRQDLLQKIAFQVAARLVNTDEPVEVYLAKGKLDDANKLAEAGLWTRDLETLETMTPFPKAEDEAYRLYNIGVANEALAYQTDDHAAAKKFLEEAAINYGKAIDAKPSEKYFLEPQNRIESAIAYYKKLEDRELADKHGAGTSGGKDQVKVAQNSKDKPPLTNASSTEQDPLTNDKIVEMFKSGVDEDTILSVIHNAPVVQFDLSPNGMIALAQAGIKGKIPAAMRARQPKPVPAKTLVK
jgi:hypothetical protein